ncbi:MAG: hypothetical protein RMY36_006655 [Nostoc sp. SerVER01]|nr:hypothetical protein [Nostoc sp. SerVER01]
MISNAINNYERRCEAACRQTSPQKLWYLQLLSSEWEFVGWSDYGLIA